VFYLKRKQLLNILASAMFLTLCFVKPSIAKATDIYLVYSGANKETKEEIQEALPETIEVKSYNAYLLAIADYSGKQKVIAKLSQAKMIVMLDEEAKEAFEDTEFDNIIYTIEGETTGQVDLILSRLNGLTQ
jgi:hypothetical protein